MSVNIQIQFANSQNVLYLISVRAVLLQNLKFSIEIEINTKFKNSKQGNKIEVIGKGNEIQTIPVVFCML